MTNRNLLIIAAVPGMRANTKLEREDNNPPVQKKFPQHKVLSLEAIYEGLKLAPPLVKQMKKTASPVRKTNLSEISDSMAKRYFAEHAAQERRQQRQEMFEAAYATNNVPREFDVSINKDAIYYKGRWWTAQDTLNELTLAERSLLAHKVEQSYQKKARSVPAFKT